ncbi:MAG: C39 family peptidase [Corynebacterium sp.]|nr:C39 family peptidase [Corynebacterium sp.]
MVTTQDLAVIMGGDVDYSLHVDAANEAMRQAQCTSILRQAMFLAQIGHESVGLRYFREIDPGYYLRGRADLGHGPGEGEQWRGAGPIQLTGKNNFRAFGRWCHQQGLIDDPEVFVAQPELVATPRWGWLAASYYWVVARPDINQLADRGDVVGVTRRINGGTNGLEDRRRRYQIALSTLGKEHTMEHVLPYPRDQVTQDTYYHCGPASVQTVVRAATGTLIGEGVFAQQLGTHTGGTDYIGQFPAVLNRNIPGAQYQHRDLSDYPIGDQKEQVWRDIVGSIDAGHGVVANIVAPPSNYPQAVLPSTISPAYGGGVVYHYITVMGYGDDARGRRVWIADSGFPPYGYWMSFNQLVSLIVPKGYAFSIAQSQKESFLMSLNDAEQRQLLADVKELRSQLRGIGDQGWPQLGQNAAGQNLTLVDAVAALRSDVNLILDHIATETKDNKEGEK